MERKIAALTRIPVESRRFKILSICKYRKSKNTRTPRDAKTPFLVSIKRKDNVKIRATARARKKRGIAANDAGSTKKIIKARAVHEVRMIRKDKKKFFRNLALLDPLPLKISILPSF